MGLSARAYDDPFFEGKRASQWFEEAVLAWRADPNDTQSAPMQAFWRLEGDAVPFLVRRLKERPGLLGRSYERLYWWMPSPRAGTLPPPRDETFYQERRATALDLLKQIGMTQRFNADVGESSGKHSIALAIPGIRSALRDDPIRAASTLWWIGPPSAPAVPDLIGIAQGTNAIAATMAVQAFGLIGPAASNAVPFLIRMAADPAHPNRRVAVVSLGGIGDPARQTVPVLASLLSDTDEAVRLAALRSMAEIGLTPEEAVAPLEAMRASTDDWTRTLATLALWNREPDNEALRQDLLAALRTDKRGWLLACLGRLGLNASSLAPEIESLVDDPDPTVGRMARRVLRAMGEQRQ